MSGHLSIGPLAIHWLFLVPQTWGGHTNVKEPGPSQAKQEKHIKEANLRILLPCSHPKSRWPAHRIALRPALWLLHSIQQGCGVLPPTRTLNTHTSQACLLCLAWSPCFDREPSLQGPWCFLQAAILSHLCVGVTEGSRTCSPPHPPPRPLTPRLQCLYPTGAPWVQSSMLKPENTHR